MISRSLFSAVEALYTRGDMDLLSSSPLAPNAIISIRAAAIAATLTLEFAVLIWPFANVFVLTGMFAWSKAYILLPALAMLATCLVCCWRWACSGCWARGVRCRGDSLFGGLRRKPCAAEYPQPRGPPARRLQDSSQGRTRQRLYRSGRDTRVDTAVRVNGVVDALGNLCPSHLGRGSLVAAPLSAYFFGLRNLKTD
jgi:hypothetical protein